jgi:sec-independent protein translocase protein TatA
MEEGGAMNEWIIVAIVAVVMLFGATKLPEIARNFGRAQGEFKKGLTDGASQEEEHKTGPTTEA